MSIHDYFGKAEIDLQALCAYLDGLDERLRIVEARRLSRAEQARLFEAAAGFRAVNLEHFVPSGIPPLEPVIHYGRNSLAAFRYFEKRFCRPDAPDEALWGYNEQAWKTLTGPGYFVARPENDFEVVIDYEELPPRNPAGWPPILPNSARLSRFIYYRTRDRMRGVSAHVSIGRASRAGKPMDNWFVLCRR